MPSLAPTLKTLLFALILLLTLLGFFASLPLLVFFLPSSPTSPSSATSPRTNSLSPIRTIRCAPCRIICGTGHGMVGGVGDRIDGTEAWFGGLGGDGGMEILLGEGEYGVEACGRVGCLVKKGVIKSEMEGCWSVTGVKGNQGTKNGRKHRAVRK
ncbi:hypothetical protein P154DRAFT_559626 [Amniculicola lignicola CBS 123094]|uniref:Uncharacterized protein n=1 Tax=Amniculicola lignicola CBS 123094 TaxID=1392246 RepID=A0A6A5WW51_9PLEO|nr:hypothetical protein P154DRAFT_559626 [Amniculicola lignicola CBS 123094]